MCGYAEMELCFGCVQAFAERRIGVDCGRGLRRGRRCLLSDHAWRCDGGAASDYGGECNGISKGKHFQNAHRQGLPCVGWGSQDGPEWIGSQAARVCAVFLKAWISARCRG